MLVDPAFSLETATIGGRLALRFFAARELEIGAEASRLFSAEFAELVEEAALARAGDSEIARSLTAADPSEALVLANGWQSWSFAGELATDERVHRARILPILNVYTDGPGPLEAKGEILSRFLTWVRVGGSYLLLASTGSPEAATPPVSFRVDRESLAVSAEVAARGARFAAGELVAEILVLVASDYFEAKDALREAFKPYGHFERLAFLGHGGGLVPGGYESWYNRYTAIDDATISKDLSAIGSNGNLINAFYLRRGKPTVFQIDDGWEAAVGDWKPHAGKFPRGMETLAAEIEGRGMIPGLWLAPLLVTKGSRAYEEKAEWLLRDGRGRPVPAGFNPNWDGVFYCYDLSIPEVEGYLAALFDEIVESWGYRYLKLDFLYAGFLGGGLAGSAARGTRAPRHARGGAAYEHYDRVMRRLTSRILDSRGRGVAYLGCGAPLEASFKHFPLMRIGADTKEAWEDPLLASVLRHQGRPAAYANLTHTIGRALLDGTVFANDPDVVFCRTSRISLTEAEKELVALVDATLASQLMFSDDAAEFGEAAEAAFTERIVALYDRIGRREFSAERLARDVYGLRSRDGAIRGIANLSGSAWEGPGYGAAKAIASRARPAGEGRLSFAPRSISLFGS